MCIERWSIDSCCRLDRVVLSLQLLGCSGSSVENNEHPKSWHTRFEKGFVQRNSRGIGISLVMDVVCHSFNVWLESSSFVLKGEKA